jgi:hypothetical protein
VAPLQHGLLYDTAGGGFVPHEWQLVQPELSSATPRNIAAGIALILIRTLLSGVNSMIRVYVGTARACNVTAAS